MIRIVLLFVLVILAPGNIVAEERVSDKMPSSEIATLTADEYLRAKIEKVFSQLGGDQLSPKERDERFRNLIREIFDVKFISRFVLGSFWNEASEEERAHFADLVIELQVVRWSQRFRPNSEQGEIEIGEAQEDGSGNALVKMALQESGNANRRLELIWRMRQHDETFKVFDVLVQGTSMLITHRNEYQSFMRRNGGLPALLESIEEKIDGMRSEY